MSNTPSDAGMLSDSRISSLYFEALIRNFVDAIKLDRHDWEDWPEDSRKAFDALINALPFDS